jgi:hypothetical protein
MELSEFIAEIKTSMKSYDAANLIDEISIQNWVIDELKRFGANIMDLQDFVLHIKNGQARLPDNYWHLRIAARVYADRYKNLDGNDEDVRYSRALYDTVERGATWTPEGVCKEITEKTVTERIYINKDRVELHYSNPILLQVSKGVIQKKGDFNCINLSNSMAVKSPFTVVINNRTIQANFSEGVIYLQYYGLLADDDGNIIIPETQHNRLKTYLEYYVKYKILEDLMLNGDDRNVGSLMQLFDQKAKLHFENAMTEAKWESLNWKETSRKLKNQSKRKMRVFENMFPSI